MTYKGILKNDIEIWWHFARWSFIWCKQNTKYTQVLDLTKIKADHFDVIIDKIPCSKSNQNQEGWICLLKHFRLRNNPEWVSRPCGQTTPDQTPQNFNVSIKSRLDLIKSIFTGCIWLRYCPHYSSPDANFSSFQYYVSNALMYSHYWSSTTVQDCPSHNLWTRVCGPTRWDILSYQFYSYK